MIGEGDVVTCSQCRSRLTALLEGDLTPDEASVVRDHIASCASCREEYGLLQDTALAVRDLEPLDLPAGFQRGLRRRLLEEAPVPWYRRVHWAIPASVSSAAVLILVLVVASALDLFAPTPDLMRMQTEHAQVADEPSPEDTFADTLVEDSPRLEMDDLDRAVASRLSAVLEVPDVQSARRSLSRLVEDLGGEIHRSAEVSGRYNHLTITFSQNLTSSLLNGLGELGRLEYEELEGHDLHTEYREASDLVSLLEDIIEVERARQDPDGARLVRLAEEMDRALLRQERVESMLNQVLMELLLVNE